MNRVLSQLALFVASLALHHSVSLAKVVIVSVDGLRPVAIDQAETPTLDLLIAMGAYHPQATCELPSWTLPNHASMVTGLTPNHHGIIANWELPGFIDATTVFDVAHNAGLRTAFFASKDKLGFLARPESLDVRVLNGDMAAMTDAVIETITAGEFDLLFMHYREPDSTGHQTGWMSDEYLAAVAFADAQLGRVIAAIDDAELTDETNIVITADHGGVGTSHYWNIPEVRIVPWMVVGPDIAAGRTLCDPVRVRDTAVMALDLLGVVVPDGLDGRAVEEAMASDADDDDAECEPTSESVGPPCVILLAGPWAALWFAVRNSKLRARKRRSMRVAS